MLKRGEVGGLSFSEWTERECNAFYEMGITGHLRSLAIIDSVRFPLDVLYGCLSLRYLQLGDVAVFVNTALIPKLRHLRAGWSKQLILPQADSRLEHLFLRGFCPPSGDLASLPPFEHLRSLEFVQGKLRSLNGIEKLQALTNISLAYLRTLSNIDALTRTSVQRIELECCPKITSLEVLEGCKSLQSLRLSRLSPIPSLGFIRRIPSLRWLSFVGTAIQDKDMTPLLSLDYAGFMNARGYSHTPEEVASIIQARPSVPRKR